MKFFLFLLFSIWLEFLFYNNSLAQHLFKTDSSRSYFIGTKFQGGVILSENAKAASIVQRNPWMIQMDFSILKNEQRVWDYGRCYSKNGITLNYTDFGNAINLGKALSIVIFIEPVLVLSKKILITLRAGTGFSYLNKIYDAQTNPDNIYYSKHISFMLMLNPNIYYAVNARMRLSFGAQFSHISNGGTHWPNWGINFPTASMGVEYVFNPQELKKRKSSPFTDRSVKIITHIFGGVHDSEPTTMWPEERRGVGGINVGALKPLGRINALGVGGEVYYDAIGKVLEAQSGKKYNLVVGSVSLHHYFFFGKVLFGQQLAYYITPRNPNTDSKLYQRYFLEYKIKGSWYTGVSLKVHGKISEYLSFSTGVIF